MEKYKIIINQIVPLTFMLSGTLDRRIIFFAGIKNHKVIKIYGNSKISLDHCKDMELTIYEPRIKDKDVNKDLENIKTMCSATSFEDWTEMLELIFKTRPVTNETYMKYLEYLLELTALIYQNLSDSEEAHNLRDLMDPLWNNMTEYERYLINSESFGNHRSQKIFEKCIKPKIIKK
jgi:hypothetical protein